MEPAKGRSAADKGGCIRPKGDSSLCRSRREGAHGPIASTIRAANRAPKECKNTSRKANRRAQRPRDPVLPGGRPNPGNESAPCTSSTYRRTRLHRRERIEQHSSRAWPIERESSSGATSQTQRRRTTPPKQNRGPCSTAGRSRGCRTAVRKWKQLRAEPLGRVDDVELQKAAKLVRGEDRCLCQLAIAAVVIRAVDRSGQHQFGRDQRDDGKPRNNKSGKRR